MKTDTETFTPDEMEELRMETALHTWHPDPEIRRCRALVLRMRCEGTTRNSIAAEMQAFHAVRVLAEELAELARAFHARQYPTVTVN